MADPPDLTADDLAELMFVGLGIGPLPTDQRDREQLDEAEDARVELVRRLKAAEDALEPARRLLLDVEGCLLAYWTDIPEAEVERLRVAIREHLGGYEPAAFREGSDTSVPTVHVCDCGRTSVTVEAPASYPYSDDSGQVQCNVCGTYVKNYPEGSDTKRQT